MAFHQLPPSLLVVGFSFESSPTFVIIWDFAHTIDNAIDQGKNSTFSEVQCKLQRPTLNILKLLNLKADVVFPILNHSEQKLFFLNWQLYALSFQQNFCLGLNLTMTSKPQKYLVKPKLQNCQQGVCWGPNQEINLLTESFYNQGSY